MGNFSRARIGRASLVLATIFSQRVRAQDSALQLPASPIEKYRVESHYGPEKSVLNPLFPRDDKVEFTAAYAYSSTSNLMNYHAAIGSIAYHINKRHSLEPVYFAYNFAKKSSFVDSQVGSKVGASGRSSLSVELPKYMAAASYLFSPFYAKMRITERSVTHFDVYVGIGAGVVGVQDTYLDNHKGASRSRPAAVLTTGLRFLYRPRWALRFELRDFIHRENDFSGMKTAQTLHVGAGLSIFFGSFKNPET